MKWNGIACAGFVVASLQACGGSDQQSGVADAGVTASPTERPAPAGHTGPAANGGSAGAPASVTNAASIRTSPAVSTNAGAAARPPANTSGAAGSSAVSQHAAGAGGGGAAASAAGAGMVGAAGAPSRSDTGSLPAIDDPAEKGPFTPVTKKSIGPGGNYTAIEPMELGKDNIKHPILIWGPGAGANPDLYKTLLDHIASHGFVIISYNSTPDGPELPAGIDWIEAEAMKDGSAYAGKLDTSKIAIGGQSAGSLAAFKAAKEPRLTTTVHINGGTFDPHTDVANLSKPALFVCGDAPGPNSDGLYDSDLARPNCDIDFMNTKAPVWYGAALGTSHTTVIDDPIDNMPEAKLQKLKLYMASTVAWLRWQLAGDQVMKALLVGPDCGFCKDSTHWSVMQKDLQ